MTATPPPPSVALIGCGPSGMFFLHALAVRRAALTRAGDAAAVGALPVVTCYERAAGPGGVWRSDRVRDDDVAGGAAGAGATTNMYEALWTNGPKEAMEFFDHTYQEHFGRALPIYLPRALVLEYILARCTKHHPDLFRDVKFHTSVAGVAHDAAADAFTVRLSDGTAGVFDRCIWAAGSNGTPKVPAVIAAVLAAGGFKGAALHSSQTGAAFDQHVRDKRVLLVGDSYSAEDLVLQALKLGAAGVDIVSRSGLGVASYKDCFPKGRVRHHTRYAPTGVTEDGYGLVLSKTRCDGEEGQHVVETEGECVTVTLERVDTVVYCTGYAPNTAMLDAGLLPSSDEGYCCFEDHEFPEDWKMADNPLSDDIPHIPLDDVYLDAHFDVLHPDLYRGRLVPVPSMFFLFDACDTPLFEIDINAWRMVAQMTGDLPLPPPADVRRHNVKTLLHFLNDPQFRSDVDDSEYGAAYARQLELIEQHWTEPRYYAKNLALERGHSATYFRYLAGEARAAGYPVDFGTLAALNARGRALVACALVGETNRLEMDRDGPDNAWRTFRDGSPAGCASVFSGVRAVPLRRRWLELDDGNGTVEDIAGPEEVDGGAAAADVAALDLDGGATTADVAGPDLDGGATPAGEAARPDAGAARGLWKGAAPPADGQPSPRACCASIEARDDDGEEEKKSGDSGDGQEVQ